MINVILWAISALVIYTGLKAFDAKMNGVPFAEGLCGESKISQQEALLVACLTPLGTLFAIAAVLYLFFEWKQNPFEIIVLGASKWVKEFFGIADATHEDDLPEWPQDKNATK